MGEVRTTIDVDVPVSTAYNQWTQFESFPEFMDGVESIRQQSDTSNHWVVKVGGVMREFDTEITEQEPDQVIAWRSVAGDTDGHVGRVVFEQIEPSRTRVDIALNWQPDGVVEKVGDAIGADQRRVDASAKEFKKFIESRGAETGAWRGQV